MGKVLHVVASELSADSHDRASSDLVVIVVVFNLDVDLHLQSWDVTEDFVELVEFFFRQLKIILNTIELRILLRASLLELSRWKGLHLWLTSAACQQKTGPEKGFLP